MKNPTSTKVLGWVRSLGLLAVQAASTLLWLPFGHAGVSDVAGMFRDSLQGFQSLLLLVAMGMLGAGLALKFLPTGSHRTKDAAGQLLDNALILGGLIALGLYLIQFAGQVATTATGMGEAPQVSSPWEVPQG